MRFLCDRMLERLCRWLRAAGHDAELAGPRTDDAELLRQARAQGRWLLTRDRKFLQRRGADSHVLLLESGQVQGQAPVLSAQLGLNWLKAPFTRCLLCNRPLERAPDPPPTGAPGPAYCCPGCERLYWHGGHVRRMREQLRRWAAAQGGGG